MKLLDSATLPLLVSLPRNDAELAEAAREGGAVGVKVHLNVEHRASGTHFGTFAEERAAIEAILEVGLPVGVVAGGEGAIAADQIRDVVALGASFVDVFATHAPAWYVDVARPASAVVALEQGDDLAVARGVVALGVDAVEASLTAPQDYRTPLTLGRVAQYADMAAQLEVPVIVPSQHAITPADIPAIRRAGVGALLIGAVVTGVTADELRGATRAFADAIRAAG